MNLRDIAEVAGLISLHSGHLIERAGGFTPAQLHDHLRLSRRGVQLWLAAASPAAEDQDRPIGVQHDVARLVEEVLVAEILTRITAAVLTAADDRQPGKPTAPFAKHIIRGQLEARRAVLERIIPVALKKGKPGTPEFREGLRQALLTERDIAASQGVYNFTEKDRYGLDDRSRVLLTVKNGKYVMVKTD